MQIRDKHEQDLLDQYAGLAMQVLLANDLIGRGDPGYAPRELAVAAHEIAREMLKVRREWEEHGQ